ncbi:single-stranded DNA-binding protein [Candidatus Margulisiibacteriota bacterium]
MYNKAFLIGRLTKDPDQRYTPSGIAVTRFTIAINRIHKNKNGENEADFIRVVAWRKLGEICGEFLKKGMLIAIEGRLQIDTYEKDGEQISMSEVVAENMQMLERKGAVLHNDTAAANESMTNSGVQTTETPF